MDDTAKGQGQGPVPFEARLKMDLNVIDARLREILDRQNRNDDAMYRFGTYWLGESPRAQRACDVNCKAPSEGPGLCSELLGQIGAIRSLLSAIDEAQEEWGVLFSGLESQLIGPEAKPIMYATTPGSVCSGTVPMGAQGIQWSNTRG